MIEKTKYYLAVDLGASSGRHILCHIENGKLITEEIYRFENGAYVNENETLCWDVDKLFDEIKNGIKKCAEIGKVPLSMGIDTWGVDFVLLDKSGKRIGNAVSYRDSRTEKAIPYVEAIVSERDLYKRTGIKKAPFNTIYQLAAIKCDCPEQFEDANYMLMLPDYFNYLLTGKAFAEYTEATTTGLIHAKTQNWDSEIISALGFPRGIFAEIRRPTEIIGQLLPEIAQEVGCNTQVVLTAAHDTASAIMAVPCSSEDAIFISSGTWSIMGTENREADCSEKCRSLGLSNEGGYRGVNCIKNIMGLWMIQQVRHEYDDRYSFEELCAMAEKSEIDSVVDCNDNVFLSPKSMRGAICEYCNNNGMQIPESAGDFARIIYRSLAKCYAESVKQFEELTGKKYSAIYIIGGGSNAEYLNQLTAKYSNKTVFAGPSEATSLGNVAAQMVASGELESLKEFKELMVNTFEMKEFNSEREEK